MRACVRVCMRACVRVCARLTVFVCLVVCFVYAYVLVCTRVCKPVCVRVNVMVCVCARGLVCMLPCLCARTRVRADNEGNTCLSAAAEDGQASKLVEILEAASRKHGISDEVLLCGLGFGFRV
jgi:hypothetical protein